MPRIARAVAPGIPHHVTQRGNRRQRVFFGASDYAAYVDTMAECCMRVGLEIWAYCLMPNHVHLIAVPPTEDALRAGIAEAHRRYARRINSRKGWRGHLWQERFASSAMDETHCVVAARYVELNPVRAGLVKRAQDHAWSSAGAHFEGEDDALVKSKPLLDLAGDWGTVLDTWPTEEEADQLCRHARTGRPLGSMEFMMRVEDQLGRRLRRQKPGPKSRARPERRRSKEKS